MEVVDIGLLKAVVGGTVGLVVGAVTCQPITGMVGGAFSATGADDVFAET